MISRCFRFIATSVAAGGNCARAIRWRPPNRPKSCRISHQFPTATGDDGDFRDRLVKMFAAEVEKRTNGEIKFEIYPNARW